MHWCDLPLAVNHVPVILRCKIKAGEITFLVLRPGRISCLGLQQTSGSQLPGMLFCSDQITNNDVHYPSRFAFLRHCWKQGWWWESNWALQVFSLWSWHRSVSAWKWKPHVDKTSGKFQIKYPAVCDYLFNAIQKGSFPILWKVRFSWFALHVQACFFSPYALEFSN